MDFCQMSELHVKKILDLCWKKAIIILSRHLADGSPKDVTEKERDIPFVICDEKYSRQQLVSSVNPMEGYY